MGAGDMTLSRVETDEFWSRCEHCRQHGRWALVMTGDTVFLCDECLALLKALLAEPVRQAQGKDGE